MSDSTPWKPTDGIPQATGTITDFLPSKTMSDQEIRARALECASRCYTGMVTTEKDVLATAGEFEAYIRDGR